MAPHLLRSAVAILRRPTPQVSASLRRSFASGGALRAEATKEGYCNSQMLKDIEKNGVILRELHDNVEALLERERSAQRSEQFQKRLSYVLVPGTIAFFIFGPKKKVEPSPDEEQSGI